MYFSKNRYAKFASYTPMPTLQFFLEMSKKAYANFKNGKKINKSDAPVVYGTTVKDFNENEDKTIARVEMNQRGVLRDFIGIDWDLNPGDEDKLTLMLKNVEHFHETYQTPIIIYPTDSYPTKPRMRTVFFVQNMMDSVDYAKAVTFIVNTLQVDPNDDGNFNIIHNFNLPVINTQEQKDAMKFHKEHGMTFLSNDLWVNVTPKVSPRKQANVKRVPVDAIESQKRTSKEIDKGLMQLSLDMKKGTIKTFNFNNWSNFFQFLHSVARAESIGSITHEEARAILIKVAGGNPEWERRNIEDYEREFPRVHGNPVKLESARPLSYYFGLEW